MYYAASSLPVLSGSQKQHRKARRISHLKKNGVELKKGSVPGLVGGNCRRNPRFRRYDTNVQDIRVEGGGSSRFMQKESSPCLG